MTGAADVAVIGAGPAGLAAGWALTAAGVRATLYDRRPVAGGRLRTESLDGVRTDVVVQLLGSYYTETFRLAREVGAADLLVRAPGRDALWRGGRAHGITYGSPASMAASSALPAGLKLRLATRYLPFLKRQAGVLDPNDPARAAAAGLDRESIAEWGGRELGEAFVELLVYPQLAAYYGGLPEATSAGFYHGLAHAGLAVELYAVRGGMGALAGAVVEAVTRRGGRFVGGAEIRAVHAAADHVAVEWEGGHARHDAAVVAVPAPAAAALAAADPRVRAWLSAVRYTPAVSLALLLDRPLAVDYFGLSFPRTRPPGDRIAAVCVAERKLAASGEAGRGVALVFPAPAAVPRLVAGSDRDAVDSLLPAVEQAFPGIGARVVRGELVRIEEGAVQFYPGYLGHLGTLDEDWLPPRLALAGDYRVAPTVEGAVRSGRRAAERLLRG